MFIKGLGDSLVFLQSSCRIKPGRKSCSNGFSGLTRSQARFEGYLEIAGRWSWQETFPQREPWLGSGVGQGLNPALSNLGKLWGVQEREDANTSTAPLL